MKPLHIKTPLIESRALSKHLGKPVELKLDALQVPESFKIRGIGLPNLPGKRCQAFYFVVRRECRHRCGVRWAQIGRAGRRRRA
jgi:hypothetical protein